MQLADLHWPDVKALSKDTPVLIPVAALEQHGHHMPVFTDTMLLGEIVRRATEKLGDRVLVAPTMWLGNSHHHLDFPGTMSASPRVYLDLLTDLMENFIHHGFKRIVFINGHGGNDIPGKQVVFELRQRMRDRSDLLLLFATYFLLTDKPHQHDTDPPMKQHRVGHACEWETSMMLRLAPHLVGDYKSVKEVEFGQPFTPATRGWVTQDWSQAGHIGAPEHSSAEKGEQLFRLFADDVTGLLERVIAWDGKSWNG